MIYRVVSVHTILKEPGGMQPASVVTWTDYILVEFMQQWLMA